MLAKDADILSHHIVSQAQLGSIQLNSAQTGAQVIRSCRYKIHQRRRRLGSILAFCSHSQLSLNKRAGDQMLQI